MVIIIINENTEPFVNAFVDFVEKKEILLDSNEYSGDCDTDGDFTIGYMFQTYENVIKGIHSDHEFPNVLIRPFLPMRCFRHNTIENFYVSIYDKFYENPQKSDALLYIGAPRLNVRFNFKKLAFNSGAGFIISCACLNKLYPLLESLMENWMSLCGLNIRLKYACDVAISYYLQSPDINCEMITDPESFFAVKYTTIPKHIENIKAGNNHVISCHPMNLDDFDNYNELL